MVGRGPIPYYVEVDGKAVTVEVLPDGSLRVDGRVQRLDVFEIQGLSLYSLLLDNVSYEVVVEQEDGAYYTLVRGKVHRVVVRDHVEPSPIERPPSVAVGEQRIRAPMCGQVVEVLVAPGQQVEAGQVIVILESMKMENEIRCVGAGVVREVAVQPGAILRERDVMAIID